MPLKKEDENKGANRSVIYKSNNISKTVLPTPNDDNAEETGTEGNDSIALEDKFLFCAFFAKFYLGRNKKTEIATLTEMLALSYSRIIP